MKFIDRQFPKDLSATDDLKERGRSLLRKKGHQLLTKRRLQYPLHSRAPLTTLGRIRLRTRVNIPEAVGINAHDVQQSIPLNKNGGGKSATSLYLSASMNKPQLLIDTDEVFGRESDATKA